MNYENILVANENSTATIIINRPSKLNALNIRTIEEIHNALEELRTDDHIRVIIITGSGDKAFVAGADISEFADFDREEGAGLAADGHNKLFDFIENFDKPIIAAINGYALGGGLELAMACHFRIACEHAKMGLPEVSLGLIPGYGGTQRLPQLLGRGLALEMIMTANMIDAKKAEAHGLVNAVVACDQLIPTCQKLADQISKNSPAAIAKAIKVVNLGFKDGVNGYSAEIEAFGSCFDSLDFKEGTTAFLQKRKPVFTGK